MPDQKTLRPSPDEITANLQSHVNNIMPVIVATEAEIATKRDIPIERLMLLYDQQRKLEAMINWLINLEKKYNPSKIISLNTSTIHGG